MKYRLLILLIPAAISASCSHNGIIPKETMVNIYHDIYLLDQSINLNHGYRHLSDSLRIYEPIFEKYGYTSDDYTASVNFYLERPEKFGKLFQEVKKSYEARIKEIDDSLALAARKAIRWKLLDSVRVLGHDSTLTTPLYRALDMMFFTKDTALLKGYPQPDSAVLTSYKLTVFELYEGNPFLMCRDSSRRLLMLPDTTAKDTVSMAVADSLKKTSVKRKTGKKKPVKKAVKNAKKQNLQQVTK